MSIVEILKAAAAKSGTPYDDVAVKYLEAVITPEIENNLKKEFVAWLEAKGVGHLIASVIANLIGVSD